MTRYASVAAQSIAALWKAADTRIALDLPNDHRNIELTATVEALRDLFGDTPTPCPTCEGRGCGDCIDEDAEPSPCR